MRFQKRILLFALGAVLQIITFGQGSIHVASGTSFYIVSGTTVSIDGLALTPSADYDISGLNTFSRSSAATNSIIQAPINRFYLLSAPLTGYAGAISIRYDESELNGLSESSLALYLFDGTDWVMHNTNIIRDEPNNTVTVTGLTNVTFSELTLGNDIPAPVIETITLTPTSFCLADNNQYPLSGIPDGGVWAGNGVIANGDGTYSFRPSASFTGNNVLTYTLTNAGGSSSATLTAQVVASPLPFTVSGGGSYCAADGGTSVSLVGSQPGITYTIYLNGTPAHTFTGTGQAVHTNVSFAGIYTMSAMANGCRTDMPGTATVSILSTPTATITASGPTTFCPSASVVLTSSEGDSYRWSNGETGRSITAGTTGSYFVTVSNASGCSMKSQPIDVLAVDRTTPILTGVPSDITVPCFKVPTEPPVTASDNCTAEPIISVSQSTTQHSDPENEGYYNYVITRRWTAVDASGNMTTQIQLITVEDKTAPVISGVPANETVSCAPPAVPALPATDNCDGTPYVSFWQILNQHPDPNNAGHYNYTATRYWQATDASGNVSFVVTQTITVEDKTAPVISGVPTDMVREYRLIPLLPVVLINDNCDTDPDKDFVESTTEDPDPNVAGHYNFVVTRRWSARDASGNETVAIQRITIQELVPPVLTLPVSLTVQCSNDITPAATGMATATDVSPVIVSYTDMSSQNPDPMSPSHYRYTIRRTWKAVDISGNEATGVQLIEVTDDTSPVLTGSAPGHSTVACHTVPAVPLVTAVDNCDPSPLVTLTEVSTQGNDPSAISYYNYTITRTWTATDAAGNAATIAIQILTVQDNTEPMITAPTNITTGSDPGKCGASSFPLGTPVTSDNCSVTYVSHDAPAVFPVGITLVTWKVTDAAGNSNTAIQEVTVRDEEQPFVKTPMKEIIASADQGSCAASKVNLEKPTFSDNCGIDPASLKNNAPSIFPVGKTIVTWTILDKHENMGTAEQLVTVLDKEKPSVKCPVLTSPVICSHAGTYTIPTLTAKDNCSIQEVTYAVTGATSRSGHGYDASGAFGIGRSVITWTVTDAGGNTSSCTTEVVVSNPVMVNIPDATALSSGVDPNTVYTGYSPASSITLHANASGGSGNYQYSWSNGATAASITVSPTVPTTYTVHVTDVNGCFKSASIHINVEDIRCGSKLDKVLVCHVPQGNTAKGQSLCVSANAVTALLKNGASLGMCDNAQAETMAKNYKQEDELQVIAAPNPSNSHFVLRIISKSRTPIALRVTDANGRVIEVFENLAPNSTLRIADRYIAGAYFVEAAQDKQRTGIKLIKISN